MRTNRGLNPLRQSTHRAAVLALDLISDFSFPDGPRVRRALSTRVAALRALLSRAHANRVPVIYVNDNLGTWRSDAPALITHCTERNRSGAQLVESLCPGPEDEIVLKPRHSAFYGTPLAALLADRKVDTLILVGVSVESCVWMTACDAHTRGFSLVIPADTVAGASAGAMRRTLTSLRDVLGARVPARATSLRLAQGRLRG
jgi:nicotinamidase-related amidase